MDVLGRLYLLHEDIGQGASATVRRATSRRGGPELAAKLLRPHLADDPRVRAVLLREEAALRDLDHPSIAAVRDVVAEPGVLALMTAFVDGRNLRRTLTNRGGTLPPAAAAAIAAQVAGALAHAHAQGVLHLDLTPENVLIPRDHPATVVVTDFGLTALLRSAGAVVPASGYEAPGPPVAAADVYALGLIIAELISGVRPDATDSLAALPPALRSLVAQLLAPDPWERPSARSAAAQFRSLAARFAGEPQPELPTPTAPTTPPRADPAAVALTANHPGWSAGDHHPGRPTGDHHPGLSADDHHAANSGAPPHAGVMSGASSPNLVVGEWGEDESTIRAEAWLGSEPGPHQIPATPPHAPDAPSHAPATSRLGPAPAYRRWSRKRTVIATSAVAVTALAAVAVSLEAGASDEPTTMPPAQATSAARPAATPSEPAQAPVPTVPMAQENTRATYADHLATGTLYVALHDGRAVAYLCDGKKIEVWFSGRAANGSVAMTSKKGAQLTGTYTAKTLSGEFTLNNKTSAYEISTVHKPSGLYRASGRVRNATVKGGWIVLPDGRQVGILTVGDTAQPAPALNQTSGTATLEGTTVTSKEVDIETGEGF